MTRTVSAILCVASFVATLVAVSDHAHASCSSAPEGLWINVNLENDVRAFTYEVECSGPVTVPCDDNGCTPPAPDPQPVVGHLTGYYCPSFWSSCRQSDIDLVPGQDMNQGWQVGTLVQMPYFNVQLAVRFDQANDRFIAKITKSAAGRSWVSYNWFKRLEFNF